jgi:hypothetical protein
MAKKTTAAPVPVEMEKVAVLCRQLECSGYRIVEMRKVDAEAGKTGTIHVSCFCNNALGYNGTILRNPDALENQVLLLKRDVERLTRENTRITERAKEDRIRLETVNNTLDKLGRSNTWPIPPGYYFGRGHGF